MAPTERIYLQDTDRLRVEATVVAMRDGAFACDRSCFYPGGGGQPADEGTARLPDGSKVQVACAHADEDGVIWHVVKDTLPPELVGQQVELAVATDRRHALSRYHTVLHVLNTIALRDYGGWITGAQIATDYARIDFKLDRLSPELCRELEARVNAVLQAGLAIRAYHLPAQEFARRGDLLRTLDARPPAVDGRVRVVEIVGFDAQACGGTHVHSTHEIGRFSIIRTENKGRINKRLYVKLDPTA
ncbi:MAG: alanyl-tRNA editing protein [Gemmatimonadota bacterium]